MSYLQLAHNEWDPAAKTSRTKVLYSFGRADQLDRAAIERLISALTRVVGVETAPSVPDRARVVGVPGLKFVESRPLGGAWLLDGRWHRLGELACKRRALGTRRREPAQGSSGGGSEQHGEQQRGKCCGVPGVVDRRVAGVEQAGNGVPQPAPVAAAA